MTAAKSRSFKPVPLGIRTSMAFTNKLSRVQTANVGGLLRGSDPKLADEVVIYSAHHDHFGIGEPDCQRRPDLSRRRGQCVGLLPGACDRARIRSAFRSVRVARSSILFVAGEERGLLGSSYYAQHPTFPGRQDRRPTSTIDGGNIFGRTHDELLAARRYSRLTEPGTMTCGALINVQVDRPVRSGRAVRVDDTLPLLHVPQASWRTVCNLRQRAAGGLSLGFGAGRD